MKKDSRLAAALRFAALLALSAPLSAQQPAAEETKAPPKAATAPARRDADERKDADAPRGEDRLAPELDRMLRSGKLDGFWIDVAWPTAPSLLTSVRVYGDGVGTWNRATQFRMPPAGVRAIAETVLKIRLGAYPIEVREEEGERKKPGERDETELYGRIIVGAGDVTHIVKQMGDKPERELEELAKKVIGDARPLAAHGERVGSLDEGLRRVGDGTLAPQTMEVLARRKVDRPAPEPGEENWMLRVNGRRAVDRDLTQRPAVERELRLSDSDLKTLTALLREAKVGALPQSLWAPKYTTVRVQVLNQVRNIQAREFAGMTAQTHAEAQKSFDRVFDWCEKTHQRVLAKGRVLPRQEQEREGETDREREKEKEKEKD
jgi:hypothetical protein